LHLAVAADNSTTQSSDKPGPQIFRVLRDAMALVDNPVAAPIAA
jgi:hypothetical protein